MRIHQFLALIFGLTLSVSGFAQTLDKDALIQIQKSLDSILVSAQSLPDQKKNEITVQVLGIKQLLADASLSKSLPVNGFRHFDQAQISDFAKRLDQLNRFEDQKVFLRAIATNSQFNMAQIHELLAVFNIDREKREAATILVPLAIDPENSDQLNDSFWTADDKVFISKLLPGNQANPAPTPSASPTYRIFAATEFQNLVERLRNISQYKDQAVVLKRVVSNSRFTMAQVKDLIDTVTFNRDKKEAATMLLPRVLDPENIDLLFDTFWTPDDKAFLDQILTESGK